MLLTQPDASVSEPRESHANAAAVSPIEDALTSRLLQSTIHALELYSIYLGKELGLYAALQSGESVTPHELARRAGIVPRYAREWLEQQAVAGFLEVDVPLAPADTRGYRLPVAHLNVLVTEDHPAHLAPLAQMVAGIGGAIEHVVAAYRSGGGVAVSHVRGGISQGPGGHQSPGVRERSRRALDSGGCRHPRAPDVVAHCVWLMSAVVPAGRRSRWRGPFLRPR